MKPSCIVMGMQENTWIDWLNHRGVSTKVIEEFGLHAGHHYEMGESIVIPITDSFNKYRRDPSQGDIKPKYKYDKGGQAALYGAKKIANKKTVLVTEGELDCLVAWSAHIPAVSSTGGAGTFLPEWADILNGKDVTLCFDNDTAGAAGMVKALAIVPWAYVLFLPDRPGVKDISDYVAGGGNLAELLRTRIHFPDIQSVYDDRAERLSLWRSTIFHDAYIEIHTTPVYVRTEHRGNNDDVSRAKEYPIGNLIKVGREGKTLCIWHAEKTPSLHWYKKTNSVYCFGGCGKSGDVIDVYRQLHNCTFAEAVQELLRLL